MNEIGANMFINHVIIHSKEAERPKPGAQVTGFCGDRVTIPNLNWIMRLPRKIQARLIPLVNSVPVCVRCVERLKADRAMMTSALENHHHDLRVTSACLTTILDRIVRDDSVSTEVKNAVMDISETAMHETTRLGMESTVQVETSMHGLEDLPDEIKDALKSILKGL